MVAGRLEALFDVSAAPGLDAILRCRRPLVHLDKVPFARHLARGHGVVHPFDVNLQRHVQANQKQRPAQHREHVEGLGSALGEGYE